jgi:2-methylisocitrate lyase-like PEP mutase family enzyme
MASRQKMDKVRAAVEAREDPDFLIIARTNAIRQVSFEESMVQVLST